jgi:hypothetical protein
MGWRTKVVLYYHTFQEKHGSLRLKETVKAVYLTLQ